MDNSPKITDKSDERNEFADDFEQQQQAQSDSDFESINYTNKSLADEEESDDVNELVYAIADFKPFGVNQLALSEGQAVKILLKQDSNWWWAEANGCHGYVPASYFSTETDKRLSWQDEEYFGNYGHLKLHQEMLSDKPRTEAYLKAVKTNTAFFKGKTVLDVGCGTGILSMFSAKYGLCEKVYAVEASDFAAHTKALVKQNGLDDRIVVIQEYVEDAELVSKVDIIISEWMGTFLLFEMMLESVIIARNKFLKSDGVIFPSSAALYFVPCAADKHFKETYQFWEDLYGLDFSLLRKIAVEEYYGRPVSDYILDKNDCLANPRSILHISMADITVAELETMTKEIYFVINKLGTMHGFCSWFEIEFPPLTQDAELVILNTGPWNSLTHWRQNLFMLDEPIVVEKGDIISGSVKIQRNHRLRRHIRLYLSFTVLRSDNSDKGCAVKTVDKLFKIWR